MAVGTLTHEQIPAFFVSPTEMKKAIREINNVLRDEYPLYRLAIKQERFYYNYNEFVFTKQGNSIYITIDFPLSAMPVFQAFSLFNFDLPVGKNANDSTKLIHKDDYFLLAENEGYYATVDNQYINKCKRSSVTLCLESITMKLLNETNCLTELYYDKNITRVQSECNFRYKRNNIESQIIEISPTEVLLYNTEQFMINCKGETFEVQGCKSYLKRIK